MLSLKTTFVSFLLTRSGFALASVESWKSDSEWLVATLESGKNESDLGVGGVGSEKSELIGF